MNYLFFVIVDAMKSAYINPIDTPFLWDLRFRATFCEKLVSSAGFTQRSVLFTGAFPDTTGNFTMFTYHPETSPFKGHDIPLWKLSVVQKGYDYFNPRTFRRRHVLYRMLKEFFQKKRADYQSRISRVSMEASPVAWPANIDFRVLRHVSISEDNVPIYSENALTVETLFDVFRENHVPFHYLMWPNSGGTDDKTLLDTVEALHKGTQVYLLQFSESDSQVHKFGTQSMIRKRVMGEIDRKLRELKCHIQEWLGECYWVIIGDHGMTDVEDYFDAKKVIVEESAKRRVRLGVDFLCFLESTMVRGKSLTKTGREFLTELFHTGPFLSKGNVVTDTIAQKYRIPFPHPLYGDILWWAESKVLIFPDFFHDRNEKYKAMHGYDPHHIDSMGTAIISGPGLPARVIGEAHLTDICPTICDLLGIRVPKDNEGKSLIRE